MESRGYDSCGIVSIEKDSEGKPKFVTTKFASSNRFGGDCIKRISVEGASLHDHYIGIGHTRWATHGDKTDINAHPHFDHKNRISLVHNGIIGNYHELKQTVQSEFGITPRSQTDTEIVAIMIGIELDKGKNLFNAISDATALLDGAYSFVLISILEPDNMYIFKNTGTMVIGVSQGLQQANQIEIKHTDSPIKQPQQDAHEFQIVASDTTVFQDYTKDYYNIQDRQIIKLSLKDQVEHYKLKAVTEEKVRVKLAPGCNHYYTMEM